MRLTCNQENLAKALSIVSRAVSSRTTMPVLGNIFISAETDTLKLSATNRQISITVWIGAKVEESGAITLPASILAPFVSSLSAGLIDMALSQKTQTVRLKHSAGTANIKGIDALEFPTTPSLDETGMVQFGIGLPFDATQFARMIQRVTFAAAVDENRPTLTGVQFDLTGGKLTMAATDGFRLSIEAHAHDGNDDVSVIVPASSLAEVAKVATESASDVGLHIADKRNQVLFAMDGGHKALWQRCEVVSELIDAKFPDYSRTVPSTAETVVEVATVDLLKAVNVALLFARDNANIVKFGISEKTLTVSATNAEMGDTSSEIAATINGPALEISFNGKLIKEALTNGNYGDLVAIELTTATRPGVMHGGVPEEYKHIIMPMQPPR